MKPWQILDRLSEIAGAFADLFEILAHLTFFALWRLVCKRLR